MSKRNYQYQKRDDWYLRHLCRRYNAVLAAIELFTTKQQKRLQDADRFFPRQRRVEAEPSWKSEVFVDFPGLLQFFKRFPSLFRRPSLEVLASTVAIRVKACILRKTLSSCGRFTRRNRRLGFAKSYCADTDFSQKCNVLDSGTQQNMYGVSIGVSVTRTGEAESSSGTLISFSPLWLWFVRDAKTVSIGPGCA